MSRADRITILLSVAAFCVTIVGTSCSTNARIGDLGARIDDVNANLSARIDDVNANLSARIDAGDASLSARIDDLRVEVAAQVEAVNARIDDLSASLNARMDGLERDIRDLRAIVIDALRAPADDRPAASEPALSPGIDRRGADP